MNKSMDVSTNRAGKFSKPPPHGRSPICIRAKGDEITNTRVPRFFSRVDFFVFLRLCFKALRTTIPASDTGGCSGSVQPSFGGGMPTCGDSVPRRDHPFWLLLETGGSLRFLLPDLGELTDFHVSIGHLGNDL